MREKTLFIFLIRYIYFPTSILADYHQLPGFPYSDSIEALSAKMRGVGVVNINDNPYLEIVVSISDTTFALNYQGDKLWKTYTPHDAQRTMSFADVNNDGMSDVISTSENPIHPDHRPNYINAVPLIDIIRSIKNIKSSTSKTVLNEYNKIIRELGPEFEILINIPISKIEKFDPTIALVIRAFRNNEIEYTPGGGGTYGQINLKI